MDILENIDIDIDINVLENSDIKREFCKLLISNKYCIDWNMAY